jgi:hypothetical protein
VISPGTGLIAPVIRMLVAPQTWPQHREARTTRFHVRISRARLAPPTTATAPRTPRIVTTRTPLFDEAGWR